MPGSVEEIGLSLVVLSLVFASSALIRRWSSLLRKLFIPTAVIGGFLVLGLGPEGMGRLSPQWFPISPDDFPHTFHQLGLGNGPPEHYLYLELNDPKEHVRWYALRKGGIWAIRGSRAFFLAPQVSDTFDRIDHLKIDGDWLLGSGSSASRPSVRYNRRTHELILDRHDYGDVDSPDR